MAQVFLVLSVTVCYCLLLSVTMAQVFLVLVNMWDLVWTTRVNLDWGLSDEAFVFGDEIFTRVIKENTRATHGAPCSRRTA